MGWTVRDSNLPDEKNTNGSRNDGLLACRGWQPDKVLMMGKRFFSPPERLWDPLSLQLNEYWCTSLGVKWPGRDVDQSQLAPRLRIRGATLLRRLHALTTPTRPHDVDKDE